MTLVNIICVFCSMTAKEQITYEVPKVASRHTYNLRGTNNLRGTEGRLTTQLSMRHIIILHFSSEVGRYGGGAKGRRFVHYLLG